MKREIRINNFHQAIASVLNHSERELRYSEKQDALIPVSWGWKLVRAISPAKRLRDDIITTEKIIAMRDRAKDGSPFKRLGQANYDFSSPALELLDRKIRCVEQEVVLTSQSLGSKNFKPETKFLYAFGKTGNYEQFDSWQQAAQIFYGTPIKTEQWDC